MSESNPLRTAANRFVVFMTKEIGQESRRCLICSYDGTMKTWLRNYSQPQFIAFLLLLLWVLPGLIFIAWGWGKYKCPKCGALAKNVAA